MSRSIQFYFHVSKINTTFVAQRAINALGFAPFAFWTDNGLENFGEFQNFLDRNQIEHITITPYSPRENGKVDGIWPDIEKHSSSESDVIIWINFYNNKPHSQLPKNLNTNTNFTPREFLIHEKNNFWNLVEDKENPKWIVEHEERDLKEDLANFRRKNRNTRH